MYYPNSTSAWPYCTDSYQCQYNSIYDTSGELTICGYAACRYADYTCASMSNSNTTKCSLQCTDSYSCEYMEITVNANTELNIYCSSSTDPCEQQTFEIYGTVNIYTAYRFVVVL